MSAEYVITFALISAAGIILASVLNSLNFARTQKQGEKEESSALAASLATMSTSLKHIKTSVESSQQDMRDMRQEVALSMRDIKQDIKEHRDRLVRNDEAAKSAHKRLDELVGRKASGGSE